MTKNADYIKNLQEYYSEYRNAKLILEEIEEFVKRSDNTSFFKNIEKSDDWLEYEDIYYLRSLGFEVDEEMGRYDNGDAYQRIEISWKHIYY